MRACCEPPGRYSDVQFHDRSPICTAALANYFAVSISRGLAGELATIAAEPVFEMAAFFLRNLGFVAPTAARRISFEQSLRFEQIHGQVYRSYGYELILIEPARLAGRVFVIEAMV